LLGFKIELGVFDTIPILSIGALSTLIPSSPGYIGTYHLAVSTIMNQLGIDKQLSIPFSIIIHLIMWLSVTTIGLYFYFRQKINERKSNE
jgi:uncharacterized membrane protein YbhN (UPF0104 family)